MTREFSMPDHGIKMEIEFKNDAGQATGRRVYLLLESGDLQLRTGERFEEEEAAVKLLPIIQQFHASYWMQQPCPVWLVVGRSEGEVRWMDITAALKKAAAGGKPAHQVVFEGERFDVMSVRRLRERMLH